MEKFFKPTAKKLVSGRLSFVVTSYLSIINPSNYRELSATKSIPCAAAVLLRSSVAEMWSCFVQGTAIIYVLRTILHLKNFSRHVMNWECLLKAKPHSVGLSIMQVRSGKPGITLILSIYLTCCEP